MPLYRFYENCGRMGDLEGIFFFFLKEIEDDIGLLVYFGEVLGKHSDISVEITKNNIKKIDADQDFIDKANSLGIIPTGYNPLEYFDGGYDDEDDE